jgi:hypothetical protein
MTDEPLSPYAAAAARQEGKAEKIIADDRKHYGELKSLQEDGGMGVGALISVEGKSGVYEIVRVDKTGGLILVNVKDPQKREWDSRISIKSLKIKLIESAPPKPVPEVPNPPEK